MEALLFILILVLFVMVFSQISKTSKLEAELQALKRATAEQIPPDTLMPEQAAAAAVPAEATPVPAALRQRAVSPPQPSVRSPQVLQPVGELLAEVMPEAAAVAAVATAAPGMARQIQQPRGPSALERWLQNLRSSEEWEALIGGRLLNRIGALALILGVAFFFKYAADQNWISQGMRVGIGILAGLGVLALAARSQRRGYAIFAQGLVGAGQAVLYLSVYASFNFYHLVPQPVALAAMGFLTAVGLAQAVYYDSLAVSLLACAGGYLTPFLLSSAGSSPAGTIVYLVLLDVGVLALLARRPAWVVLEPIALGATYLAYFTWYVASYSSDKLILAIIALSLFWALFLAFEVYSILASRQVLVGNPAFDLRHLLAVVNGALYYGGLFALLGRDHHGWLSLLTLAIGAVYVSTLLALRRRRRLSTVTAVRYTLTAMILLVAATAIQFRGFTVVILWSLEALPLVWLGVRARLWYVWRPALVVYALALCLLFATPAALQYSPLTQYHPLLSLRTLAYLVLIAALATSTLPFRRLRLGKGDLIEQTLQYGWTVLLFLLLTVESNDLFRRLMVGVSAESRVALEFERSLAIALVWLAFSLVLVWFGLQKRILPWVTVALGVAGLAIGLGMVVGITYQPIQRFTPVLNVRVAVFALLIAGVALHLRRLSRERETYPGIDPLRVVCQVVILLLGFELVSAEINDYFQHRLGHPLPSMDVGGAFVEMAILAAVWMLYSLLPTWYGVRRHVMPLISLGLTMTAAATGVAALAGIVFQPTTQFAVLLGIRPFVLVILVAGLMIQLRLLRQSQASYRWAGQVVVAVQAAILLLGFGLISAETRDAFGQRIAGASSPSASTWVELERLAFSLVWLAYALLVMGLGIWRRARWMRLGAMALFAFVILKVFIYDLSFLGAAYRPVSFAGLGIILLGVSYLYQRYRSLLLNPQ